MSIPRPIATTVVPLVVGLCWLALPFTTGDSVSAALAPRPEAVQWVVGVGLWAAWAVGLGTIAIARTSSLTIARFIVPAAPVVAVWAAADTGVMDATTATGLVVATAAATLALTALYADRSVNGSSYGAERRFALRPPAGVLVGLLPLLWVVVLAAVATGPLLLANQLWIAGAVATAIGLPVAVVVVRRTHVLSRRWLVLVPAGVVVHDPLMLSDSLLVQRANLASLAPALADTTATDLTMGALGLALELRMRTPSEILTNADRRAAGGSYTTPGTPVDAVLVSPSRPGAVMRTVTGRAAGDSRRQDPR